MKTIIRYDLLYIHKTSKWVILVILGLFLAGLSALSARYFNELIELAFKQEGVELTTPLPEPTIFTAYEQFYSNFNQIFLLAVMFVAIAYFTYDKTKGHYPLLFSRPIKKYQYLLTKSLIISALILVSTLLSALFFGYYAYMLFGELDVGLFFWTLLSYMVFLIMLAHVGLVFSVLMNHYLLPLIATILIYFVVTMMTMFKGGWLKYLPHHLIRYPLDYASEEATLTELIITLGTGLVVIIMLYFLAVRLFNQKALA